jgi:hypothetical protein
VAAALVALRWREAGHAVGLAWAPTERVVALEDWLAADPEPLARWGEDLDALDGEVRLAFGGAAFLLAPSDGDRARLEVAARRGGRVELVGLGAEAAGGHDPERAEARLQAIAARGGLLDVLPVRRFAPSGRLFVELVEVLHQASGPAAQNVLADVVRAALFGRCGRVPVSLSTRTAPPRIGASTALVVSLAASEVLAALDEA